MSGKSVICGTVGSVTFASSWSSPNDGRQDGRPYFPVAVPVAAGRIGKLKESRARQCPSARFRFDKIVWLFVQANC